MKKKIKLRDMSKEQWEKFECGSNLRCEKCIFNPINCCQDVYRLDWTKHKDLYSDKFLNQEIEIEVPDILTKEEKEYLGAVIRPFRNRVISISKYFYVLDNVYSIEIYIKSIMGIFSTENIKLPLFKNEMYEKMEIDKKYTLEDLGL